MNDKEFARFKHMLDSAQAILAFSQDRKRSDLEKDRQLFAAIVREFMVLGEAAARISDATKKEFPSLPWKEMIGMRNQLIHVYFDVDYDIIWSSIQNDLPLFCQRLEQIILSLELKV